MTAHLLVHGTGPLSTIQDLGRSGLGAEGVPRSGAADRSSLRLANRLLGNPEADAAIEVTFGGLAVELDAGRWCVVTGAECPVTVDDLQVGTNAPFLAPRGSMVRVGVPTRGLRAYLAVRGGLASPRVLGSRSQDVLSGITPLPLAAGVQVPLGPPPDAPVAGVDLAPVPAWPKEAVLDLHLGPRHDWVTPQAWAVLTGSTYTVSSESNRIGLRFRGPALARAVTAELPSEGLIPGAMQVPPSGEPVVFLADHPTTGGYPVCAVVTPASMRQLAQLVPGQRTRFRLSGDRWANG